MFELSYDDLKSICQASTKLNKIFKANTNNIMEGKIFSSGLVFAQEHDNEFPPHPLGFTEMQLDLKKNECVIDVVSYINSEEWFYLTNCGTVYYQHNNDFLSERTKLPLVHRMNFKEKIIKIVDKGGLCSFFTNDGSVYIYNNNKPLFAFGVEKLIGDKDPNNLIHMINITFKFIIIDIVASNDFLILLTNEGKCYGVGDSRHTDTENDTLVPQEIKLKKPVKKIAGNAYSWFYLCNDDTLYGFGRNVFGQLGIGHYNLQKFTTKGRTFKVLKNCQEIYSYEGNSFAITKKGDLYVCGNGERGVLGDGDVSDHAVSVFKQIVFPYPVMSVSGSSRLGPQTTFIMTIDFKVYVCGWKPNYVTGKIADMDDDYDSGTFKLLNCPPVTRIVCIGFGAFYFTPQLQYSNRFKCVNCKINNATLQSPIVSRLVYCSQDCANQHLM